MTDMETIELIVKFRPEGLRNEDGTEWCFKSESMTQLVRCKECKHYFRCETRFSDGGGVVTYHCELNHENMRDDFYCADGERRTDNENHDKQKI